MQWYLAQHPDVAAGGINPLLHYLRYGAGAPRMRPTWPSRQLRVPQRGDQVADQPQERPCAGRPPGSGR
jgi:hypothetical protein